jgi:aromatic-L-amino-acid decarboxylase
MDIPEFRSAGHTLVERLARYFEEAASSPVLPDVAPAEVNAQFQDTVPQNGQPIESLLQELDENLFPYCTQLSNPGYLGLITSSPLPIGALADLVASSLNQNIGVWTIGPSATAIERQTVRWLCEIVGYGDGSFGQLTSGGMGANLTALKLARDWATDDRAQKQGLEGRYAVYVSEQRHISIDKAVDVIGLGRDAVRIIETDDKFSVRLDLLEEAIAQDRREGVTPVCIVGLAGTTNTGSVDDLHALREIADRERVWLHVDAAYGGAMKLSHRWPALLDGLELADSVIVDPHKWFFAPVDAGAVLVKDASRLDSSFGLVPAYLTDEFDQEKTRYNFYEHSLEQSRRFRALKVWMILKRYGASQIGAWVDANTAAVQGLWSLVQERPPFEAACFPLMSAMCLRFAPEGVEEGTLARLHAEVASALEKDGRYWIGTTRMKGKSWFRLCAVNLYTTDEHLRGLLDLLEAECKSRLGAMGR